MTHTAAFDAADLEGPAPAESGGWLLEAVVHVSIMIVMVALGVMLRTSLGFGIVSSIMTALTVYWGLLLVHALVRRGQEVANLNAEMADLEDENEELRRMAGPHRSSVGRASGGSVTHVLPGLGAPNAAARPDAAKIDAGPSLGAAKAAPVKVPARAPEAAPPAPAKAAGVSPEMVAKQKLEAMAKQTSEPVAKPTPTTAAKPQAAAPVAETAHPSAKRPAGRGETAPAAKMPAPIAPGSAKPLPPPIPAARVPTPAAAQALGIAVPDRKAASDRDATARAPVPGTPAAAGMRPPAELEAQDDAMLGGAGEAPDALLDPRAQDIAIMQSLIKGLADQLNAPTAPPLVRTAAAREAPAPAPSTEIADMPAAASGHALDTVDGQVGALRNVATALRAPEADPYAPSHDVVRDRGLLAQITGAVEAARIDVYLDPILGLDDRKARHFEVSVRLRNDDGELLDPRDFGLALRGTGLTPRIEAHTFTESIRLAGQFAARGADAALFSNLSGESIRNGGFHDALAGALTPDVALASRLVMSVAQSEIRAFGPAHWDALAAMAQTGLRYALVDVVDLDVDFEGIKRRGFDFVRLDAQVFLDGLPAPHGVVPAADLCRYLSRLGFSMIVGRIADERELVKVLGFGALLGQGQLFGAPRPVKVEHVARQTSAA